MKRRDFILLAGSLLVPPASRAQAKAVRLGILAPIKRPAALPAILNRLGELGYVDGKNLSVEFRSTDGAEDRALPLARELVLAKCDLIIAYGSEQGARALTQATASIPIVILAIDYDPLEAGIVKSLRRPGGNVTGLYNPTSLLAAKRLELLREVLPGAKRVLALVDSYGAEQLKATRVAAARLGIDIVPLTFTGPPYDFEGAFEKGRAARADALIVFTSRAIFERRTDIARLVAKSRLPTIVPTNIAMDAGLLSYGVPPAKSFERAGDIVASILKGAKPGEIAVEQAAVFQLVLNLKVAKELGLKISQSVLLRADGVIE